MKERTHRPIGLAIVGAGRVGLIRGRLAAQHPSVQWIGIAELDADRGKHVGEDIGADFVTADYRELLRRPEVTAAIIATDENEHVGPILAAVERRVDLMIEKPLATDLGESERVLRAIQQSGVDAVVGYTQRFRRRFLVAKEKVRTGQLGEVTLVTSRAFMNRLVAIATYERTAHPELLSPMVVSGTHSLDVAMWLMEGKTAAEVYARSVDKVLGPGLRGIDGTFGIISMTDGTIYSLGCTWALPKVWPGSVYSLEIGIVGTQGVLTIDDTHRDLVLASEVPQPAGYTPEATRQVDFLTSYPPGDVAMDDFWGPMREETNAWYTRIALRQQTPHATAAEAHNRLMLTKAMDLSAAKKCAIPLPITPKDLET
jgi:predicted dehydrogenase